MDDKSTGPTSPFTPSKLWEHAKQAHYSELMNEGSEAEAKEQFVERALRLAASNNVAADPSPRPASNGDKSHNLKKQDGGTPPVEDDTEGSEGIPEMLLQPETRPISHEQLVIEVKGIYAGLVMVEAKCIDIDKRQSAAAQEKDPAKLKNDQWQSLIALHKQLLHEHYDFFLVSQHPSASPALCQLATKYSMPARMWRHGTHAFLEVLRHRLPESLEHMLAFIYIAYTMVALLYETLENGGLLEEYISRAPSRLKEKLVHAAVSNIAALFEYGTPQENSSLCLAYQQAQTVKEEPTEGSVDDSEILPSSTGSPKSEVDDTDSSELGASVAFISYASRLASAILAISLKHTKDENVHPLLHVYLTFIWSLVIVQQA
ncbi:hypothetical protein OEA41_006431 [Lepraria neglecta]|uniref:Uncharacterized protein n=1 Tax=Lepraria neglecta TaxID=209136 RepID=A0AAD9ZAB2_9LECA|nr:hypothetical protein OEA41_006431 [Lepraria neglecta]